MSSTIKLLLDEDVWVGLAEALREDGVDVVTVTELGRKGLSDEEQLAFAISHLRTISRILFRWQYNYLNRK